MFNSLLSVLHKREVSKFAIFTVIYSLLLSFLFIIETPAQQSRKLAKSENVKNQDTKNLTGNISGKVFNDLSGNGKLNPNETGVADVKVTVFDASGTSQGSILTDIDGNYALNVGGTGVYRVEFSDFPAGFLPAKHSITSGINSPRTIADSGTSVQFVQDGNTSNVNFALFNPSMVGTVPPVGNRDILQNGFTIYSQASDINGNTLFVRDITQFGTLWDDPANRTPIDSSSSAPVVRTWSTADFNDSSIFGITFDRINGTIFGAVSPYYSWNRVPRIYKIDAVSGAVTLLSTLPHSAPQAQPNKAFGIAAIEFDQNHNHIFAANMDDGKIYRVDAESGNTLTSFDPRNADASGAALPPLNELVLAIAYNRKENRLYYSMWDHDPSKNSTMYSISFDGNGNFIEDSNRLEFEVLPGPHPFPYDPDFSTGFPPVTDIEFNEAENRMLVCENSMRFDTSDPDNLIRYGAHNSRLLEYMGSGGSWTIDPTIYNSSVGGILKYEIGDQYWGTSSRGGTAWAYKSIANGNILGDEEFIANTADTVVWNPDNNFYIYGITMMPSTGGSDRWNLGIANSVGVNLDSSTDTPDKWVYGDLDIRKWARPPIEIGNRVWSDEDADGIQDAGEFGFPGVTVNLYRPGFGADKIAGNADDDLPIDSTLTDSNGDYYFLTDLQGANIEVRLDNPADYTGNGILSGRDLTSSNTGSDTIDSDGINTTDPNGSPSGIYPVISAITPNDAGTADHTLDFGFSGTGINSFAIGNRVWFDTNNNGVQDAVEIGINNVSVSLFADADSNGTADDINSPIATVTTDAQGFYLFGSLTEGSYIVRVNPSNFQTDGRLFKYKNSTFTETNANADTDVNDNGINNLTMPTDGISSGTIALGPGFVEPIGENQPVNYVGSSISGNQTQDNLSNATVDFGFNMLRLSGHVFYDPYNTAQITNWRVPGIPVRLFAADGTTLIAESLTEENTGYFHFDYLDEGTYIVKVAPYLYGNIQIGMVSCTGGISPDPVIDPDNDIADDDNGNNGTGDFVGYLVSQPITLTMGSEPLMDNSNGTNANPTVDFGFMPGFSIGNRVWLDPNNNGVIDETEQGIAGVSMSLFADADSDGIPDDINNPLATLTTDANGYYRFDQLYAGDYVVRVNPINFQTGKPLSFALNSVGVVGGNSNIDLNDHGIDGGNPLVNGILSQMVTLNLDDGIPPYNPPQPAEPTSEIQPSSYGTGSTNGVAGYDLEENLTVDFGFYFPPTSSTVSLGGQALTYDGRAIYGTTVTIVGGNLTQPLSVKTNAFGYYKFDNLAVGETYVVSVKSKKYTFETYSRIVILQEDLSEFNFTAQ